MDVRKLPAPMKRVVHLGSRSYGRLTAPARMTPTFLICGGQRCGTTSLYRALAGHPVVLKAVLHKGVHYFDTSYDRGMGWYKAHFPLTRSGEKLGERYGVQPQTFESSPYYMYHPQAAARIARDLPQARLAEVDLSGRVPPKMGLHLPLQDADLGVQHADHRDHRPHGRGVGAGEHRGLVQRFGA